MRIKLAFVLVLGLLLAGCRLQAFNTTNNGGSSNTPSITAVPPTDAPTLAPTNTPIPTATLTLTPTPDPTGIGLPAEPTGTDPLDFVASLCKADWFTRGGSLPCPGDPNNSDAGFVMSLPSAQQSLPPGYPVLLTYAPQGSYQTIFSKYPAFTVKKGDRFRAVLACRAHTFCDVDFSFGYYSANGSGGIAHWPYRFDQQPIVVDYSLDGLAGSTVQFNLSLLGTNGPRIDAYGVWIMPHIYRPAP